jgi:hypothetical protein
MDGRPATEASATTGLTPAQCGSVTLLQFVWLIVGLTRKTPNLLDYERDL